MAVLNVIGAVSTKDIFRFKWLKAELNKNYIIMSKSITIDGGDGYGSGYGDGSG